MAQNKLNVTTKNGFPNAAGKRYSSPFEGTNISIIQEGHNLNKMNNTISDFSKPPGNIRLPSLKESKVHASPLKLVDMSTDLQRKI